MKAPLWERIMFWLCDTFGHGRLRDPWTGPLGRRLAICRRCNRIVDR